MSTMNDTSTFNKIAADSVSIGGVPITDPAAALASTDALTEGATTIGGTNNGDIPDLTPTVGSAIAAFTDPPSAAEMALLRTFVNALKTDQATQVAAIREVAAKVNEVIAELTA